MLDSINPTTNELIKTYKSFSDAEIETTIEAADNAFPQWHEISVRERGIFLNRIAGILRNDINLLSELISLEMGKPITESRKEIEKCAWVCEYYAGSAEGFLEPERIKSEARDSYVIFQPLGVILAIMPWNFPFWQVFRFAAAALAAGNTCILKHASNVSGCALAIEEVFKKAGAPEDIFRVILAGSDRMQQVIQHKKIKAVTLTGSTHAGRTVSAAAGEVLKKTVLELGGSDPYLVLHDADLEHAANICVSSRMINSGQSCIAAKRFIVDRRIQADFEGMVVELMDQYKPGDPMLEYTRLGPMARHGLRDALHKQVQLSIDKGAHCLLGGKIPEGKGAFYPATVLSGVKPGSPAYSEELFGPVASIIPARDEEDAVRLANDTDYGLGAAIFTRDLDKAARLAAKLEAGCCFVNDLVRSDPRLPFGGIKDSGYGRELSHYGIKEFVNIKTVYIA
ncbi:MAG TPA: NAD-dependent succinate-semialdehyde dehydrogenase [Gammaproteobacteria bacterium]